MDSSKEGDGADRRCPGPKFLDESLGDLAPQHLQNIVHKSIDKFKILEINKFIMEYNGYGSYMKTQCHHDKGLVTSLHFGAFPGGLLHLNLNKASV